MLYTQNLSYLLPTSVSWHSSERALSPCLWAIARFFVASSSAFIASCLAFSAASLFSYAAFDASSLAYFCYLFLSWFSCFLRYFSASISANSRLILGSLSCAVSKSFNSRYRSAFSYLARFLLFSCSMYLRSYLSCASLASYSSYCENSLQLLKFSQNL